NGELSGGDMARILIIDDDQGTRQYIGRVLEGALHSVAYAVDGIQGIDLYRKSPFDVVVVDLVMPEKNGLQTTRELCEEYQDARVVAITGQDPENLPMAEDFGAMACMTKPIEPEDLLEAIEGALSVKRGWDCIH
ncbi:MAG: response regulator, partial [Myxococcota bacterium]|nr:response regulator [Myxococcota bacterium]